MTETALNIATKLRKALDGIVDDLEREGRRDRGFGFIEKYCDDELRQRYGVEDLLRLAYKHFERPIPELSEKATNWFHEFNKQYFGGALEDCEVIVHYGHSHDTPLIDRDWFTIDIYGVWEDEDIKGILLNEMMRIATSMECGSVHEREWSRLKEASAPVLPFGGFSLSPRKSPISSENEPPSQGANDSVST